MEPEADNFTMGERHADVLAFLGDTSAPTEPVPEAVPDGATGDPASPPALGGPTDPSVVAYNADLVPSGRTAAGGRLPRKALAGALSFVLVAGAAGFVLLGPSTPSAEAAHYKRHFTAKEKHTYDFEMRMKGAAEVPDGPSIPMDLSMNMRLTERTVSVANDGTAVVRATVNRLRASVDGRSVALPVAGATMTMRIAPDGTVLDVHGLDGFGLGQAGPATDVFGPEWMGPLLPSNAVAPGDAWTVTQRVPMPAGAGEVTMTSRNKLISVRSNGPVETAVIGSQVTIPMKMSMSMDELMSAAAAGGQAFPTEGLPRNVRFVYDGAITLDLVQTVERATSRPITVTGDGRMELTMLLQGFPGGDQRMTMGIDVDVSMNEV